MQPKFVLFVVLAVAPTLSALGGAHPPNWKDPLAVHHIPNTKRALITALRNDNAEVRSAAAWALAEHWPKYAVPPIAEALSKEKEPMVRVSMAFDLVRLGDGTGRDSLIDLCHNATEGEYVRLAAVTAMMALKDDSCTDVVLNALRTDVETNDTFPKNRALELVPEFIGRLNEQEAKRVLDMVVKALEDPDPIVRRSASSALRFAGDVAAILYLESALATEKDEDCRLKMAIALQSLKTLKQTQ